MLKLFPSGESEGKKLTAEGQYPISSRNSSGFRTADSDRILSAARRSPASAPQLRRDTRNSFTRRSLAVVLVPLRPLRAGRRKKHAFLGKRRRRVKGGHPTTRPRHACREGSGVKVNKSL